MASPTLKAGAVVERLRESLWLIPGVMVIISAALAAFLVRASDPAREVPLKELLLPASPETAVPILQVVGASVITVTSVVFSLTVVALQITAGNYSPRALRTFLRDLGTQLVLGTFLATFAYSYILLQNVRGLEESAVAWGPQTAFLAVPVFVLASLVALVFFIHHVTQAVRVDFILKQVLNENLDSIATVHSEDRREAPGAHPRDSVPQGATQVRSTKGGFVQAFGLTTLIEEAQRKRVRVAFRPTVGDHVLEDAVVAWVWTDEERRVQMETDVEDAIRDAVQIGDERSIDHDVAYGIRQLVDIAVRALSSGVNDPNTAVSAVLHLSVSYSALLKRQLGPVVFKDEDGAPRVTVPYPSLGEYLTIMVQQVGHYGRADVMVVLRLLRALAELKSLASTGDHEVLDRAIDEVVQEAEQGIDVETNLQWVRDAARDAREQTFRARHYTAAG